MIYSYILKYDSGYAPNINVNILTLACCKPIIRLHAKIGDFLIGFNDSIDKQKNGNRIIYIAKITDIKTLKGYYEMCEKDEIKRI